MSQTFVRNFEIESLHKTLQIQQKTIGDVSCVLWDAAIVLSKYLEIQCKENKEYLKSKIIYELGAGLGCVGLVAACFGALVTMTDLPEVIPNLSNNIEFNKGEWQSSAGDAVAKQLTWGDFDLAEFPSPNLLLAADCVYYEESVEALVQTMVALCNEQTEVIICQEIRDTEKQVQAWKLFMELFNKHFHIVKVPLNEQHSLYSAEEIVILKGRKSVSTG